MYMETLASGMVRNVKWYSHFYTINQFTAIYKYNNNWYFIYSPFKKAPAAKTMLNQLRRKLEKLRVYIENNIVLNKIFFYPFTQK